MASEEDQAVKIAVPVDGDKLCSHFGQSPRFAFFEVDPASREVTARKDLPAPAHEPGVLPRWLSAQGADVVIAGGIGARARNLLQAGRILVVSGAPEADPRTLVTSYLGGGLGDAVNPCGHHDHTCSH
jgi:ATP-binding protein involved in chromosome partitioning